MKIGNKKIGYGQPCYIIGEIGINHNGDLDTALELIRQSANNGADAVKFQKRVPEVVTPTESWNKIRKNTPWGDVKYIDYRRNVEFGEADYSIIDEYCEEVGIDWFASAWDIESVDFLEKYNVVAHKIASSMLTNIPLVRKIASTGKPIIASKGGSTMAELDKALDIIGRNGENIAILHCVATYPCPDNKLNLMDIPYLKEYVAQNYNYAIPVGYSGHEKGLATTVGASVLGARIIERHITLDRAAWGSDQSASVEPQGFAKLIRDIRACEKAMSSGGTGMPQDIELKSIRKLRYFDV